MLQGSQWQEFLNSGPTKEELIRLLITYLETREGMSQLGHPCIATARDTIYSVIGGRISMLHKSNRKEADTHLLLHPLLADSIWWWLPKTPMTSFSFFDFGKDDNVSEVILENAKELICSVLYSGKQKETYIETRI